MTQEPPPPKHGPVSFGRNRTRDQTPADAEKSGPARRDSPEPGPGGKVSANAGNRPAKPRGDGAQPPAPQIAIRPIAPQARVKKRHRWLILSLMLVVVVPVGLATAYLYLRAADQYASTVGFSVRTEEVGSAVEILGGITDLGQSSGSDTDILYEYIQSQELVTRIDATLDLRKIYSRPDDDPVFAFDPTGSIEDLVTYWGRMVKIYYDGGTGLIELRVLAFRPEEATAIAGAIFLESSRTINELSAIAREDATRYAAEDLDSAVERLKQAREALTQFRSRTQIVDPEADIQVQMGLLNTLNQQLAEALIESDLLNSTLRAGDPRIATAGRRITVIEARIADERRKFGVGGQGPGGEDYATVVAEFERLSVDREFAEQAYIAALANYDTARAEAQRKSRYLAAYVKPTRAETSQYPQREVLIGLTALFLFLGWAIAMLVYYSVRDRR